MHSARAALFELWGRAASKGCMPGRTSSVRGGKNSNEKNGFPELIDALIL